MSPPIVPYEQVLTDPPILVLKPSADRGIDFICVLPGELELELSLERRLALVVIVLLRKLERAPANGRYRGCVVIDDLCNGYGEIVDATPEHKTIVGYVSKINKLVAEALASHDLHPLEIRVIATGDGYRLATGGLVREGILLQVDLEDSRAVRKLFLLDDKGR